MLSASVCSSTSVKSERLRMLMLRWPILNTLETLMLSTLSMNTDNVTLLMSTRRVSTVDMSLIAPPPKAALALTKVDLTQIPGAGIMLHADITVREASLPRDALSPPSLQPLSPLPSLPLPNLLPSQSQSRKHPQLSLSQ